MGIFYSIIKEAPEDEEEVQDPEEETTDKETPEEETSTEEEGEDNDTSNGDDNMGDSGDDDASDMEDEGFDLPDDDSSGDDFESGGDEESGGDADDLSGDTIGGGKDSELEQGEQELFSNLTSQQINIRDKELVKLFIELYNKVIDIISKSDRIVKTSDTLEPVEFCINKLNEMKDILYDYLTETYSTKTYIQNLTIYHEFLATLNGVNKIISRLEINKKA